MSRQAKIIVGVVIAILILSTVGVVVFVGRTDSNSKTAKETVRIEVRSFPAMTIKKDGHKLGKTPVSFIVPKATDPISLDAEWTEQRVYRNKALMVPRQAHKDVVPDRSMTVDFKASDGKPVELDPTE